MRRKEKGRTRIPTTCESRSSLRPIDSWFHETADDRSINGLTIELLENRQLLSVTLADEPSAAQAETIDPTLAGGILCLSLPPVSPHSGTVVHVQVPAIPTAPAGLVATADANVSTSQIQLSWSDDAGDESGFVVEKSTDGGTTWRATAELSADTTTYTDSLCDPGTRYVYRVCATSGLETSAYSADAAAWTAIAAPAPPTAAAATNGQLVSLSWPATPGATGYRIQRSQDGGVTWSNLSVSPSTATSAADYDFENGSSWRVVPGTSYEYRLVNYDASSAAYTSDPVTATTSSFSVLDSTFIAGKPDLSAHGVGNAYTTGQVVSSYWDPTTNQWAHPVDIAALNTAAGSASQLKAALVLDIESWKLDVRGDGYITPNGDGTLPTSSVDQVINNLEALVAAVTEAKAKYPDLKIGFYATPANWGGYSPEDWDHACYLWDGYNFFASATPLHNPAYDFVAQLDFISPVNYLSPGLDLASWNTSAVAYATEAQKMARQDGTPGKPVIPFISPYSYNYVEDMPVASDQWKLVLAAERADTNVDGVVIWAGEEAEGGGEGWLGSDNQSWWNVTRNFINEATPTSLPAPTGLASPLDNSHLAWSYTGPAIDGFVIERSSDGITWDSTPHFAPEFPNSSFISVGDSTQWIDTTLASGSTLWYRVAAMTSTSVSPWSNVYRMTPAIDGTQLVPAGLWSFDSNGNWNFPGGVVVTGGSTLGYTAVNFGNGADQVKVQLVQWNDVSLFVGGSLDVYIDNDPTNPNTRPTIEIPIASTALVLNGAIAPTGGVHNVWFRFNAPIGKYCNSGFQWFQFVPAAAENVVLVASNVRSSSFYLRLEPDGQLLDVWQDQTPADGPPMASYVLADIGSFIVNGGAVNTSLTIDGRYGNPVPTGGMSFNRNTGIGASSTVTIIGTPGDDYFQNSMLVSVGSWDQRLRFNWRLIDLGNLFDDLSTTTVNYATGGGADSVGVGFNQELHLIPDPGNGSQAICLASLTIGGWSSRVDAPTNSIPSTIMIDQLTMWAGPAFYSIGSLDLGRNNLLLGGIDVQSDPQVTGLSADQILALLTQTNFAGLSNGIGIDASKGTAHVGLPAA